MAVKDVREMNSKDGEQGVEESTAAPDVKEEVEEVSSDF